MLRQIMAVRRITIRSQRCVRRKECLSGDPLWQQSFSDHTLWRDILHRKMQMGPFASSSTWSLQRDIDPEPDEPAEYEKEPVTGDTVSQLCQQGRVAEAVEALGVLVRKDRRVAQFLFYVVLKSCMVQRDLVLGRRVHGLAVEKGYESDTFLCNHVIRMYSSHGRLQEAMDVFTVVTTPDSFMWSSIISAHVSHGQAKQGIQLYHRMCRSCVKPDGHVFVAALQACARGADLKSGQRVHTDVLASGVEPHLFVCNSLLDMYVKCNSLKDAQRLFDGLGQKDVVTWNTMIAGYSQQGMGQAALCLYSAMQEEGKLSPDSVTFVCLLQACASVGTQALETGKQLHAEIRERGLQADVFVASGLVNMYAACGSLEDAQGVFEGLSQKNVVTWTSLVAGYAKAGSLEDAQGVFDRLGEKNVVTWNAMIAGYTQQGMGQEALHLYRSMLEEGAVAPDAVTFVCLLQACARVGTAALETGKELAAQIRGGGLHADVFVANSLVNMYAKCGSLQDARGVFDTIRYKNVVTWNTMIAGCLQHGMGQEALCLYRTMQEEGIIGPNSVTFVCLLQACASLGNSAFEIGKQLHAQIGQNGLQTDGPVASSLVHMYAKCGSLSEAQGVFDGLAEKDVVTWNALIAGYSQKGLGQASLLLYKSMKQDPVVDPDSVTFVSLLQACASLGHPGLERGKRLHEEISERGHESDVFVSNSLVNMYAKCGGLNEAQQVFEKLSRKDVVSWTSLIAGYSHQGRGQEALQLHRAMQEEGIVVPDSVTFVSLLQACASVGTPGLAKGKVLHAQILEQGLHVDVAVGCGLVNMYAKCGSLEDALGVFDGFSEKNLMIWNAMIAGYSQRGMGQEALYIYGAMQQEGLIAPDPVTYVSLLQACASVGSPALEKGKQLHAQTREQGLQCDVFIASSLVNMYAKCGSLEDARRVFGGLGEKDVVTWNAMIAAYSQQGMGHEALRLYSVMQEGGIVAPDAVTFVCLLQACANLAALDLGRQLHAQIKEGGLQRNVRVGCSLINMYGKSGSMVDAQRVFEALPRRDDVAWNTLIAGYTRQGDSELVFDLFRRMREEGIQPAGITFLSVLTVCSYAGLVNKGQEYFEAMRESYDITPTVGHYTCIVDLLGRAGRLRESLTFVRTMPVQPDAAVWLTLLSACHKWSNVEVGLLAFDEAVKLDEKDSAAYVLMSNIYTGAEMWGQAQEMQARRIGIGAWKQPGQSWWTDKNGVVHSFLVGDTSHPESKAIYVKLKQLHSKMKAEAFVPQLNSSEEALFPLHPLHKTTSNV